MNWGWAKGAAVLSLATLGSAFGQNESADSLAARLRKVEDRQAIEQLLMGDYPRALDARDWAAYAAPFTKAGTLIMGSAKRTGPAAIQEFFTTQRFAAPPALEGPSPCPAPPGAPRFMHVVNNLTLQISGDTATDQAYWETILTRDCKSVVAAAGHYEDVLKREDGHWRFFMRQIFDDFPPRTTPTPTATSVSKP